MLTHPRREVVCINFGLDWAPSWFNAELNVNATRHEIFLPASLPVTTYERPVEPDISTPLRSQARDVEETFQPEIFTPVHVNVEPTAARPAIEAVKSVPRRVPTEAIRDAMRSVSHMLPSGPFAIPTGAELP